MTSLSKGIVRFHGFPGRVAQEMGLGQEGQHTLTMAGPIMEWQASGVVWRINCAYWVAKGYWTRSNACSARRWHTISVYGAKEVLSG